MEYGGSRKHCCCCTYRLECGSLTKALSSLVVLDAYGFPQYEILVSMVEHSNGVWVGAENEKDLCSSSGVSSGELPVQLGDWGMPICLDLMEFWWMFVTI